MPQHPGGSSSNDARNVDPAGSEAIGTGQGSQQSSPQKDGPLSWLRNAQAILAFLSHAPAINKTGDFIVRRTELDDLHHLVQLAVGDLEAAQLLERAPRRIVAATFELDTNDHGTHISYPVVLLDDGSVLMLAAGRWQQRLPLPGTIAGLALAARVEAIRSELEDTDEVCASCRKVWVDTSGEFDTCDDCRRA